MSLTALGAAGATSQWALAQRSRSQSGSEAGLLKFYRAFDASVAPRTTVPRSQWLPERPFRGLIGSRSGLSEVPLAPGPAVLRLQWLLERPF